MEIAEGHRPQVLDQTLEGGKSLQARERLETRFDEIFLAGLEQQRRVFPHEVPDVVELTGGHSGHRRPASPARGVARTRRDRRRDRLPAMVPDLADDLGAERGQWKNLIGHPALDDEARHAPDDGALFVLDDDLAAGGTDALASDEPVLSHARHHDREHVTAVHPGDRSEQHIGRRPAGILRRLLMELNPHRSPSRATAM